MLGSFHVVVAPQDFIDAFQDATAGRGDLQGVVSPALNWEASFPQRKQQNGGGGRVHSADNLKVIKCN